MGTTVITAKKWVKVQNFDGAPKKGDFRQEEEKLDAIKDGEFLCEAVALSVDPYMRLFGNTLPDGATFMGEQVAKVVESRNKDYAVGSHVCIMAGWRTHTVCDGTNPGVRPIPELNQLPVSLALGAVGMPATTAYFGLTEVGNMKEGDTVFVNGAAGMVGSVVGQMAKAKGCKAIGMTGSDAKLKWLTEELGFDAVINYKTCGDFDKALSKAAPGGIDLFYDNVGSDLSSTVFGHMNENGRVVVGGTMAGYNDAKGPGSETTGVLPYHHILMKTLTVRGFTMWQYLDRRQEGEKFLAKLIQDGKMKYKENRVTGFSQMPQAFIDMLKGEQLGKSIVMMK